MNKYWRKATLREEIYYSTSIDKDTKERLLKKIDKEIALKNKYLKEISELRNTVIYLSKLVSKNKL